MTMDDIAILDRLTEVVRDVLDDPEVVLRRETTAADVEDWDSVTNIQIMVAIEDEFGVRLRTGEIAGLENVGEIVDLLRARI